MNQAESEQIINDMQQAGYSFIKKGNDTDIYIIHTCAVTNTAEKKCLQELRRIRRSNPTAFVVLAGCAVQSGSRLMKEGCADLQLGQVEKLKIGKILKKMLPQNCARDAVLKENHPLQHRSRALLNIQTGCNFNCSYCIVPKVRGAPQSRDFKKIISEAEQMLTAGYREIVVTGINIGLYNDVHGGLVELLKELAALCKTARLRLSSLETSTVEHELIELIAENPPICAFLHCPLQSGSDKILQAMGRRYSAKAFNSFIRTAAETVPGIGIGTDIICGFPGETDEDFQQTCQLVDELPFSNLHVFPFSPRPETRAAHLPDRIDEKIIRQRCDHLIKTGTVKRHGFAQSFAGRKVQVLAEKVQHGRGMGWTAEYLKATVPCTPEQCGQLVDATVVNVDKDLLHCRLI